MLVLAILLYLLLGSAEISSSLTLRHNNRPGEGLVATENSAIRRVAHRLYDGRVARGCEDAFDFAPPRPFVVVTITTIMVAVSTPSKTPVEGKKATAKLPSPPPQPKMNAAKAVASACNCAKSALVSHPSSPMSCPTEQQLHGYKPVENRVETVC